MKNYESITLISPNGDCELELVPEFGGLTNRLCLKRNQAINIIAGLTNREAMEANAGYSGVPLFPFANRLDKGRYSYANVDYQLEQNEPARATALHGFLYQLQASISVITQDEDASHVSLTYNYDGSIAGYPFPAKIVMKYSLGNNACLSVQFTVLNLHTSSIPVGIGWHPYFQLGQTVDELRLQMPPSKRVLVDDRLLPTGEMVDFTDFLNPTLIGDSVFDDCFVLPANDDNNSAKVTLWSDAKKIGLEMFQTMGTTGFNYIQVCIPPDRKSIAIEPVSCGINAFNTGDGVIHLAAGESFTAEFGVRLIDEL